MCHCRETWDVSHKESKLGSWKFVFRWVSKLWLVWWGPMFGLALWNFRVSKWTVTLAAARSGLTCSFSPLRVLCSGGLLLTLQSLRLPLALHGPLLLLARWEVRLTPFGELYTEMPLSAMFSRKKAPVQWSSFGPVTTKHYMTGLIFTTPCIFASFSPLHTEQECSRNHSSVCHRAGIREQILIFI